MTRAALTHNYPCWEPPEDDPNAPEEELREIWRGKPRIVRSARRARLLKRRGVPMWDLEEHGRRLWIWFVQEGTK